MVAKIIPLLGDYCNNNSIKQCPHTHTPILILVRILIHLQIRQTMSLSKSNKPSSPNKSNNSPTYILVQPLTTYHMPQTTFISETHGVKSLS